MFSEEIFLKRFVGQGYDNIRPLLSEYTLFNGDVHTYYELLKMHESLSLKLKNKSDSNKTLMLHRSPEGIEYNSWDEEEKTDVKTGDFQCEVDEKGKHHFKRMTQRLSNKGVITFNSSDNSIYYYSPETLRIIFGSNDLSKFLINTIDKSRLEKVGCLPDGVVAVDSNISEEELLKIFMSLDSHYSDQLKLKLID